METTLLTKQNITALLRKINNFFKKTFWYRFVLKPILIVLPSVLLGLYRIDRIQSEMPSVFHFIDTHVYWLVLVPIFIASLTAFEDFLDKKFNELDTLEDLIILLEVLDNPVNKKAKRFLSELNLINESLTKEDADSIFLKITKPNEQLAEIIRSIHTFFNNDCRNRKISTVLYKIEDNVAVENWCFFPDIPEPEKKILHDPSSLAANAVKSKDILVVENIANEKNKKRKKIISKYCFLKEGSAICYPIKVNGNYPLAIKITSNTRCSTYKKN